MRMYHFFCWRRSSLVGLDILEHTCEGKIILLDCISECGMSADSKCFEHAVRKVENFENKKRLCLFSWFPAWPHDTAVHSHWNVYCRLSDTSPISYGFSCPRLTLEWEKIRSFLEFELWNISDWQWLRHQASEFRTSSPESPVNDNFIRFSLWAISVLMACAGVSCLRTVSSAFLVLCYKNSIAGRSVNDRWLYVTAST